jgi:hypothetical protein
MFFTALGFFVEVGYLCSQMLGLTMVTTTLDWTLVYEVTMYAFDKLCCQAIFDAEEPLIILFFRS